MVLDSILSIVVEVVKDPIKQYVVMPLRQSISYAFKWNRRVKALNEEVDQLKAKRLTLQQSVDVELRNAQDINPIVTAWLSDAEVAIREAEELAQRKEEAEKKCFVGLCPNMKAGYRLSKNAEQKATEIQKLLDKQGLDPISFPPHLEQIIQPPSHSGEPLSSRESKLNQIMDALRDVNLSMIGVWGMGGIGKTTLAKEVREKATQEKLFEKVVLVPVSQNPDLKMIQGEIADFLGLKFGAEETSGRASLLHKRLENSRVLIILDDLWKKLDLVAVGIPAQKVCKIMLTSRKKDVQEEMGAKKLFPIVPLEEAETLSLFMSIAEPNDDLRAIATEIAKKCAGLPLLIQIVAARLKNKESYMWKDTLKELATYDSEHMYEKVYKVLESSYENLPTNEMKSFFLLCALFGQSNIQIQYLLIYSMGLGLFKHTRNIEDARSKVFTLIYDLKANSLLLDGDMVGFVKMHDVVRDTARNIAYKEHHAFFGTGEFSSRDWPDKDCTRMSLQIGGVNELPLGMDYPKAELFLLFAEDLSLKIPDSFFDMMKELKVVDLRGARLVSFPSSLCLLEELQTLCLIECRLDNVAVLGQLKQLELLSFAGSKIVKLPREIEALIRLKLLDLRDCSSLQLIPAGVLSKLCSLEELYMLNSFDRWNAKGNVSVAELENLARMSTLEIQIPDLKLIPAGFTCFNRLKNYKISIGSIWDWDGQHERSKTLKLKVEAGVHLEDGIQWLLRETEDLDLNGVGGIASIFHEGFPKLKHLHVENDFDIQHLIKSTTEDSFPVLESLYLNKLQSMEKICSGQLGMGSLGKLQILTIIECGTLKSLFSSSSAECLQQLEELVVADCENLEAVVEHHKNEVIELTQLSSLRLGNLPRLIGFCKVKEGNEQKRLLFNTMVSFPNLTSLAVSGCDGLKQIFTASVVKCLMQLKKLEIVECELVEEIIRSVKREEREDSTETVVFPKLDYLVLQGLPNLKRFSSCNSIEFPLLRELSIRSCKDMGNFVGNESEESLFNEMVSFPNLAILEVKGCESLKHIFTASPVKCLVQLKNLAIVDFVLVEEIIKSNKMEEIEEAIVFPQLDSLWLYRLPNLKRFSRGYSIEFPLLRELTIRYCHEMGSFWGRDSSRGSEDYLFNEMVTFSNLETLKIWGMNSIKYLWDDQFIADDSFFKLKSINIEHCSNLLVVFPSRICTRFRRVETLCVSYCDRVEEIYQCNDLKEMKISFSLRDLKIQHLPLLKGIWNCNAFQNLPSAETCVQEFLFNLEEMTTDEQAFHLILQITDFSVELRTKLKKVSLHSLDEETSIATVFGFLSGVKSLETLVFERSSLEGTLGLEDRSGGGQYHCLRVKHLELRWIRKLKHIIKKDSQHLQPLQTLKLMDCHDLMSIAPSSTSLLQNLTTLHLIFCSNVTNLVTTSTAKTMVHLKEMKVINCKRIEEIVAKDADDTVHDDEIIFNKLQYLELQGLFELNSFCSNKYTFSFPLLEIVTISSCSRMKTFCGGNASTPKLRRILFEGEQQWEGDLNATVSSQLTEWVGGHLDDGRLFPNLKSLKLVNDAFRSKALSAQQMQFLNRLTFIKVRDCESIQVVFDLEDDVGLVLPKLNYLELINLPLLTQLCNKAPKGILDFNKLKVLKIENCSRLVYAFTWSMASCLSQLKTVQVENCDMMETLIADEEDATAKAITFGKLKNVFLKNMPKFSSIYSGRGDLECSSVKEITIMECPIIKAFFPTHRVFPKLIRLSTDIKCTRGMMQFETPTDLFPNLEVRHCSATTTSHASLVHFLSRLPNLDQLKLCDSSFKELFNSNTEEPPTMPRINSLTLYNLHDLNNICWQASLFQSLETLRVSRCGKLVNLASASASFQNLVSLEVDGCNQLMNLVTPSVARNMVQLKMLKVSHCKMLMEIVGNGIDKKTDGIVFTNLKTLELIDLQSLKAFSLTHCNFEFPCLDQVILQQCPNLRIFCHRIINTPMLNCVKDSGFLGNDYWNNDLNNTTKHLYRNMVGFNSKGFFQLLKEIKLSAFPLLKENWEAQFPISFLSSLERIEVDSCELFANAIPSHLLQHLKRLRVLIVKKCDSVEQIWNANIYGVNRMRNLEELQLIDLPRLKQVWIEDPQQILSFKYLQILKVHNCGSLTSIYNLSMALSLKNLQQVEVKNCSLVKHIIMIEEEEMMQKYQTILPSLQSITLLHLTDLLSFCSTSGVLECPSLKTVEVVECPNLKLFGSAFSEGRDSSITVEDPDLLTAFLGNKMVMPRLEELKVEWKTLKDELIDNYQSGLFSKLKCIELGGFEVEERAILPPTFLQHFLKLEKLAISDAVIEEMNLDDLSIAKDNNPELLPLMKLKLSNLTSLKYIVRHDCQSVPLFHSLVELEVVECRDLKTLVPPSVSFHNLTDLEVLNCDGLINLISASTARSLVQLRRMSVKDCKMMQQIVEVAGEEYEIRFSQLEYLELDGLPFITCFNSGNCDFGFPSLQEVVITECPSMKNFAERVSVNPKLRKIKTGRHDYDWEWEGSLNHTIQALYMEKDTEEKASQNISQDRIE